MNSIQNLFELEVSSPLALFAWSISLALLIRGAVMAWGAAEKETTWKDWRQLFCSYFLGEGDKGQAFVLGWFEIIAYAFLMAANLPLYIGGWLVFKTVNRTKYREQDRGYFNRYLLGNALVILAAYLVAAGALWCLDLAPRSPIS